MEKLDINYKQIVESLKLLALPYKEQKSFFPDFVDLPFELADTYHNIFILLPNLIENRLFEYEVIANLMRLENLLSNIMGNPLFEETEENIFLVNDEWNFIRDFSKKILIQIGEQIIYPDPNYI